MSAPASPAAPGTARHRADAVKVKGNKLYRSGDYAGAAVLYSRAIEICSTVGIYYSNRGLCYKQLKQWGDAYKDANHAIELDDTNVKALLLRGESLCQLGEWERGFKCLQKATRHATRQKLPARMLEDMRAVTERHQASKHAIDELATATSDAELLSYVEGAMARSLQVALGEAKTAPEPETAVATALSTDETMRGRLQAIFEERSNARDESKREVPDWLCGRISMELLRDPVVSPSGHVYERKCILAHLARNSSDPVTRAPLTPAQLVTCIPLRHAAEEFLAKNPWATPHDEA